jgi:hypothetical protein
MCSKHFKEKHGKPVPRKTGPCQVENCPSYAVTARDGLCKQEEGNLYGCGLPIVVSEKRIVQKALPRARETR